MDRDKKIFKLIEKATKSLTEALQIVQNEEPEAVPIVVASIRDEIELAINNVVHPEEIESAPTTQVEEEQEEEADLLFAD